MTANPTAQLLDLMAQDMPPSSTDVAPLLKAGADVNRRGADGLPFLLRVLSLPYNRSFDTHGQHMGYVDNLHRLLSLALQHGADLNALTPDGIDAASLAADWKDNRWALKKLACETRRRADPELFARFAVIETLWPEPNAVPDDHMRQAFLIACHNGTMTDIDYYLHCWPDAANWYTESDNQPYRTGLMAAVGHGGHRIDVAKRLIAAGANVNWQNADGISALLMAVTCRNGGEAYIPLLIDAGADPDLATATGETALDAAANPKFEKAQALLKAALEERARVEAARAALQAAEAENAKNKALQDRTLLNRRMSADPRRKDLRL